MLLCAAVPSLAAMPWGTRKRAAMRLVAVLLATAVARPAVAQSGASDAVADSAAAALAAKPGGGATRSVVLRLAAGRIRVDGVMDEPAWSDALVIPVAYEVYPGDNLPAPVATECRVTYDTDALYLGCLAHDPDPSAIRARFSDRDRALQDDYLAFWIDAFDNHRRALQFRVNPLGVQTDAAWDQADARADLSWDAIWSSAGRITPDGYVVEAAIPFRSMRFPRAAAGRAWGIVVERFYPRSVVHQLRSLPLDRNNSCVLCQAGSLAGLRGISPGRDVELSPTLTAHRTDVRAASSARIRAGAARVETGLTGRWAILPNLQLGATANPDFSQVEADVAQLEVNTRFARSYPEKRPFFLQGADAFQTFIPLVFTRTLADPRWGVKLTGEEGGNTFGLLLASDRVTSFLVPGPESSRVTLLEQPATTTAVRYQRTVGLASSVGVLYTGRAGEGYSNHVVSGDAYLRLTRSDQLRMQLVRSLTNYPDSLADALGQHEGRFAGNAFIAQISHGSRAWSGYLQYQDVASGYRADAGFSRRVGVTVVRGKVERLVWGRRGGWFTQLSGGVYAERLNLQRGGVADQAVALVASYAGPWQSSVSLSAGPRRERYSGTVYDLTDVRVEAAVQPGRALALTLSAGFGTEVDYENTRAAGVLRLEPGVQLQAGRHLELDLGHALHRLSADGREILRANLTQARVLYHFDTRTLVRATVQYQWLTRNPAMSAEPVDAKRGTMSTQLLLAYKLNPQAVLFLGYSDARIGDSAASLQQTDRTAFFKVGYAWYL